MIRDNRCKKFTDALKVLENNSLESTRSNIIGLLLPNTEGSMEMFFWMEEFFTVAGDHIPNANNNEIHVDNLTYQEYYHIYLETAFHKLKITAFIWMWKNLFSHVKIREFKNVTGKCKTCESLSRLRCKFKNPKLKSYVTELHDCHRQMYMSERLKYYERRQEAINNPTKVLSCISDGMAQSHTSCPWLGNVNSVNKPLEQKILGIIDHGRKKFTQFRVFPSVSGNTNLNIHAFLLNLEDWRTEMGEGLPPEELPWPEKIYWQVDGGPENANKCILGFCEYLVAVTPIKQIVLSRLPVGHTHEDIDAKFGTIWTNIRVG